jgi:hypothetical protein
MKQILLIVISCIFCSISLHAQDVEGVWMDSLMTKDQVIEKYGEPDEYLLHDYDLDGIYEWYHYGEDYLLFINERLYAFYVSTSRWSVLMKMIDGGVKIGDQFSTLSPLSPILVDGIEDSSTYYVPLGDYPLLIEVHNGLIADILFTFRN